MSKPISIFSSLIVCLVALFMGGCTKTDVEPAAVPAALEAPASQLDASKAAPTHKLPVTFYTVATGSEGTTYTGTVRVEGGDQCNGHLCDAHWDTGAGPALHAYSHLAGWYHYHADELQHGHLEWEVESS